MTRQHGGTALCHVIGVCIDPRRGPPRCHGRRQRLGGASPPCSSRVSDTSSCRGGAGARRTPERCPRPCFYLQDRSLNLLTLMAAKLHGAGRLRFTGQQRRSVQGAAAALTSSGGVRWGAGGEGVGRVTPPSFIRLVSTCLLNLSGRPGNKSDSHQPFTKRDYHS